ncbi:MAG TPA: hypothetical protein PK821_04620, partial [Victivallales bacterium]|nr:hypothetical protein [Victivallales bacterium]
RWSFDGDTGNAVGYTLKSFPSGTKRIYGNLYDVIYGQDKLLITPDQVRKQIEILEECHRQNPLPRKKRPNI